MAYSLLCRLLRNAYVQSSQVVMGSTPTSPFILPSRQKERPPLSHPHLTPLAVRRRTYGVWETCLLGSVKRSVASKNGMGWGRIQSGSRVVHLNHLATHGCFRIVSVCITRRLEIAVAPTANTPSLLPPLPLVPSNQCGMSSPCVLALLSHRGNPSQERLAMILTL